jgi:hypothetical protein
LSDASDEAFVSKALSQKGGADITLKRAAMESERTGTGAIYEDGLSLFDRLRANYELRRLQQEASERLSRMLRYEGSFRITIPGDAFEGAEGLQLEYPLDASTGRVPIMVPVEGDLYEITLKQAEKIYELRKNKSDAPEGAMD